MNQDKLQKEINMYICCYNGHEDQKIRGFCMFYDCENSRAFCLRCLTTDMDKFHQGHQKDYLKIFKDIITILIKRINELKTNFYGFQELNKQVNEYQNQIGKLLIQGGEKLKGKLQKTRQKITIIIEKISQRIELLIKSKLSLSQQNYQYFRDNIKQLIKSLDHQQKYNLNEVFTLLQLKQKNLVQQVNKANLPKLNQQAAQVYFYKGLKLLSHIYRDEFLQEAITFFDSALIRDPQLSLAQICKGKCLKELDKFKNALKLDDKIKENFINSQNNKDQEQDLIKQIDDIIRLNPNCALGHCIKGYLLEFSLDHECVIRCFDEAIKLDPNNAYFYNSKGILLHQGGQYENSIQQFVKAIKLNPKTFIFFINKGISLNELGLDAASLKNFDTACSLGANSASFYRAKGNTLYKQKQYEAATNSYNEAIRLMQNNPYYINYIRGGQHQNFFVHSLENLGQNKNAITEHPIMKQSSGVSLSQQSTNKEGCVGLRNELGQGTCKKSEIMKIQLEETNPEYSDAQYDNSQGISLNTQKILQNAPKIIKALFTQEQKIPQYQLQKGVSLNSQELFGKAMQSICPNLLSYQCSSASNQFNRSGEINNFNKAQIQNSENPKVYYNKGMALFQLKKYQEAIECYNEAIKLQPDNADYYISQGRTFFLLLEYQDSNKCFDQAIRLKSDDADCYISKGKCLFELQQYQNAVKCYAEAIRLKPQDADYYICQGKTFSYYYVIKMQLHALIRQLD